MFEAFSKLKYDYGFLKQWIGNIRYEDGIEYISFEIVPYILCLAAVAVMGYYFGSINFGIILSKFKYKDDVRTHGSGNAGATNMLRTYGKGAAALTYLGDFLKAALSVIIGIIIGGEAFGYVAGFMCMLGHAFPVFYGFKGGKGVACASAVILFLEPVIFLVCAVIFVATVAMTRYVSLGSVFALVMFPVLASSMYKLLHFPSVKGEVFPPFLATVSSIAMAVLVVYLHRKNMARVMNKTENKISFKKKEKTEDSEK
ncbi:MAG: glycerol-3-phosphate 1-O-acyltransferase PlsY [Ruminococcaceae bacterium]|nr:glycerol-3-phosphate 1-O-acyltransferase PlsY [Oscillospiraceae bacterium]